jgi:VanZ family protein
MQKTSAWPLALAWVVLIVYASLYPFGEWRDQGIVPWAFLTAPLPRYWTGFDLVSNVAGYIPLGFLCSLAVLRSQPRAGALRAFLFGFVPATLLSLLMETLQSYLPMRVPSNVDLALNSGGAGVGALLAVALEPLGALARWSRFRERWFTPHARGALVLLALWPVALLFPAAVPFGLGQVFERLEAWLGRVLEDTPFLDWVPVRYAELQPLVPGAEALCVALGLLAPCLLGYSVMRSPARRAVLAAAVGASGLGVTCLSAALSFGPANAWEWITPAAEAGMAAAALFALLALVLPRRGCAAVLLLALGVGLSVLNQAPTSAYFAQTLQVWEQGRFIHFHGLAQWLGWVWPYATLAYVLVVLSRREREN